jgi:hypothetical protein
MTPEHPNWWVRFWAGSEPTKDPRLAVRRVFLRIGLIIGLFFAAYSFFLMRGVVAPPWTKVVAPLAMGLIMFGVIFGVGVLAGYFLIYVVGDKRES